MADKVSQGQMSFIYIIMYARARVHLYNIYNMYDSPDEKVIRCIVHEVFSV